MSFFNRKQKNRRLGRVHVLDVKLRSEQVRRTRVRLAALMLGALFGTVLGVYALWRGGEWVLNRVIYENPAFAIRTVEVQTDGVIASQQLRRWANVRPGQNLLALDLARVKRDLEMVPALETVSVERVLPRTLRLRVTEREPVLQVAVPRLNARGVMENFIFHLDAKGVVMQPLDPESTDQAVFATRRCLARLVRSEADGSAARASDRIARRAGRVATRHGVRVFADGRAGGFAAH
jgi:cell division septal protein FtsQ